MRKIGMGSSFGLGLLAMMVVVGCGAADKSARSPESSAPSSPAGYPGARSDMAPAAEPGGGGASAYPAPPPAASAAGPSSTTPAARKEEVAATGADKKPASPEPSPIAVAPVPPPPPPPPPPKPLPRSGQLTAGVWDDNRNFDFFKPYAATFTKSNGQDFAMFSEQELTSARDLANNAFNTPNAAHTDLDVQLVLDTTGSMGDELQYLQSEFDAIAAKIKVKFPNVTPRWSLVVYRDKGDDYLTRQFDFTTDTNKFRRDLRAQSAAGGGDTPEAVVEGLSMGLKQNWRTGAQQNNVAKMIFWVADAPAHPGEGKVLANVIRNAKAKGVHIYPIASSDTDDAAEYQMRSAAQMTGGRYVFLTNDSGIGNDHAEPHIPCYNVTRLDNAIVRMIQVEMSGRHIEPEQQEVVRSVGRPNKEGKCQLSSGMLVASF